MKDPLSGMTRRRFVRQFSCAAVGSTALYSTVMNMLMTGRLSAQTVPSSNGDYKATVCIFLAGGNDSFNMLIPTDAAAYAGYRSAREELALASDTLLPIVDSASGKAYGLHPSMEAIQGLYDSGDLAFVCNVGALTQPVTLAQYNSGDALLPLGMFSHSDQQMHWQTSTPDKRGAVGWLGRVADVLGSLNETSKISMNISLAGANILQTGNAVIPYSITTNGAIQLDTYTNPWEQYFKGPVDSILDLEYRNLLQRTYSKMTRDAIELGQEFNLALGSEEDGLPFTTQFPDTDFGNQLRMIARTIAAHSKLGQNRQSFLSYGWGWDHHDTLLVSHAQMLGELSEAIGAFWAALGELGLRDSVTVFTASDFGRTLSSNGDGTDHAWGGNQIVLGGGLQGGRLYGSYPESLAPGNDLDIDRGRLIPTTSVDEFYAEIALWLGAQKSDLSQMLPNIERFYDPSSSNRPLGIWS